MTGLNPVESDKLCEYLISNTVLSVALNYIKAHQHHEKYC